MPVQLLDFKKHQIESKAANLKDMIQQDVLHGFTPDLARLRYAGPQYMFLWDQHAAMETWANRDLEFPVDIRTELFDAVTVHSLMPFANGVKNSGYRAYLPLAPSWPMQVKPFYAGGMTSVSSKPIAGKVVSVGVKAIRMFDKFYLNGLSFDRIKMPIMNPHKKDQAAITCWMYVNKISSIMKYDPHEQLYKPGADIDIHPFNATEVSGVQAFRMPQYIKTPEGEMAI